MMQTEVSWLHSAQAGCAFKIDTCASLFIAALLVITEIKLDLVFSNRAVGKKKNWYVYTMGLFYI